MHEIRRTGGNARRGKLADMLYSERRQHRRYVVQGKAGFKTSTGRITAELVDLGKGGVLVLASSDSITVGEPIHVHIAIVGYPVEIETNGRVARIDTHSIGIVFVDSPVELDEAVLWLEAGFLSALL
jgi:hypothetical protein